jgi:hypothetical protein
MLDTESEVLCYTYDTSLGDLELENVECPVLVSTETPKESKTSTIPAFSSIVESSTATLGSGSYTESPSPTQNTEATGSTFTVPVNREAYTHTPASSTSAESISPELTTVETAPLIETLTLPLPTNTPPPFAKEETMTSSHDNSALSSFESKSAFSNSLQRHVSLLSYPAEIPDWYINHMHMNTTLVRMGEAKVKQVINEVNEMRLLGLKGGWSPSLDAGKKFVTSALRPKGQYVRKRGEYIGRR